MSAACEQLIPTNWQRTEMSILPHGFQLPALKKQYAALVGSV
jgi:hypothetical protein